MNPFTQKIAEIIEWELSVNASFYEDISKPSEEETLKAIVDSYLSRHWQSTMETLPELIVHRMADLPSDLAWSGLVQVSLRQSLSQIDWASIANYGSIPTELRRER
jgi:hypothetical protein